MSTPYACPLCGYYTAFGNPASIQLHATVSHSGKTPIAEVAAPTCPKGHPQSDAEYCTPDFTGGCIQHVKVQS